MLHDFQRETFKRKRKTVHLTAEKIDEVRVLSQRGSMNVQVDASIGRQIRDRSANCHNAAAIHGSLGVFAAHIVEQDVRSFEAGSSWSSNQPLHAIHLIAIGRQAKNRLKTNRQSFLILKKRLQ